MPKWLATSSMTASRRRAAVEVRADDALVLRAQLDAGPVAMPFRVKVPAPTWSTRGDGPTAGEVLKGVFRIAMGGLRVRPGGTTVTLGNHRMSAAARSLGMEGRALATLGSPHLTGELGSPTSLGHG
jgi:hypothetical protein